MRTPTASELLLAWERGLSAPPWARALALLSLASPGASEEMLAGVSLGARDARLLALRERLFGPHMTGVATCPACNAPLEIDLDTRTLRAIAPADPAPAALVTHGDYVVQLRLLDTRDLAIDAVTGDQLLARSIVRATRGDRDVLANELPADVIAAVSRRLSELDPQADVHLSAVCPQCAHAWQTPFDIVSFLWSEVHAWACRLLQDVHALASAYGWNEAEILALSPARRQAYLALVHA